MRFNRAAFIAIGFLLSLGGIVYLFGLFTTNALIWPAPWVVPLGEVQHGAPTLGVPYRVSLYTHCGLRHVEFDGSDWAISGVLSDGSHNPPPKFGNPTDHGTITLVTHDIAIYRSEWGEERSVTRGGGLPWIEGCL